MSTDAARAAYMARVNEKRNAVNFDEAIALKRGGFTIVRLAKLYDVSVQWMSEKLRERMPDDYDMRAKNIAPKQIAKMYTVSTELVGFSKLQALYLHKRWGNIDEGFGGFRRGYEYDV